MDVQSIKTFLTLSECQRLGACAEQLCLTKSAVSARIKQLETQLGKPLFERGPQGMVLTQAGQRFYQHAIVMQQRWERARRDIEQDEVGVGMIRIGAHPSLAQDLLLAWGGLLKEHHADLSIHLEADYSKDIIRQVAAGELDAGLIYIADTLAGLVVEEVFEERLIMVSVGPCYLEDITQENYLYLDWGWGYNAAHSELLPQLRDCRVSSGLGELGLPWLMRHGGATYLPERVAVPKLATGELCRVEAAPVFRRPVYATYASTPSDPGRLADALQALSQVASEIGARE